MGGTRRNAQGGVAAAGAASSDDAADDDDDADVGLGNATAMGVVEGTVTVTGAAAAAWAASFGSYSTFFF